MSPRTPRLILLRHSETAWTLTGQHTSTTDLSLTPSGSATISRLAPRLVGPGLSIDPVHLQTVLVSPRTRAAETLSLLNLPSHVPVRVEDGVREWTYGRFEGKTPREIKEIAGDGFSIWRDGCGGEGGGESAQEMRERVDGVIHMVREMQRPAFDDGKGDVLIVSHGHFLRCLAKRWLGRELHDELTMLLEPGGCGVLSYAHHNIDEPAFVLGGVYAPLTPTPPKTACTSEKALQGAVGMLGVLGVLTVVLGAGWLRANR